MGKHEYKFTAGDSDHRFTVMSDYLPRDPEWIAEDAAEQYHNEHDGWESRWPITFEVFDGEKSLGRFQVELEAEPVFRAYPET